MQPPTWGLDGHLLSPHCSLSPQLSRQPRTGFPGWTDPLQWEDEVCGLGAGMGTEDGVNSVVSVPQQWAWTMPRGEVVEAAASQTATSCGRCWPFPGQTGSEDT